LRHLLLPPLIQLQGGGNAITLPNIGDLLERCWRSCRRNGIRSGRPRSNHNAITPSFDSRL